MNLEKSKIQNPKSKIAIVGTGFLGLTLALRLTEQGNKVTVYESAAEIGGLASVRQIGDFADSVFVSWRGSGKV